MTILEIGCGSRPTRGCLHLDRHALPHVEIVHDLNKPPLPFLDCSFEAVYAFDVVEHIDNPLALLEEIHRILKPNGILEMRVSYYLNPFSWKDPTHKHHFSKGSFDYFDKTTDAGKKYGFYTQARFRIITKRLVGRFGCLDLYFKMQKV